jgi:hypothetical protein
MFSVNSLFSEVKNHSERTSFTNRSKSPFVAALSRRGGEV